MKVKELMTRQVATVRPGEAAAAAARMMWDCDCGALPVVDDDGRAIAMVTDRDLCMTAMFRGRPLCDIRVADAMSKSIASSRPDDTVTNAEKVMRQNQIRRLPVVDGDRRLVGMLSLADIVRAAGRERTRVPARGARRADAVPAELAATLADICMPRQSGRADVGTLR